MHTRWILISAVLAASSGGCKNVDCGVGTVERDGNCQPANETVGNAMCGPFTELQGDKCVPMFPPTMCDPGTTASDVDPATGVTTCVGTGGGGCSTSFACPAPTAGKQSICGQLYDFENNAPFAAAGATGAKCTTGATDGPCSLSMRAYDAIAFGTNPATAVPLTVGDIYIDDCGHYRVSNITVPAGPFIGLGIDDTDTGKAGPTGTTNTVGVATPKQVSMATKDFEAWIVKKSTTDQWQASAPALLLSNGYYVNVFRAHRTGFDTQAGVQSTRGGSPNLANDFYFTAAQTTRQTVDTAATVTGANGTAIITNAAVSEGVAYGGQNAIPASCVWEAHAGASLPNIVFIQLFRPVNAVAQTCPL